MPIKVDKDGKYKYNYVTCYIETITHHQNRMWCTYAVEGIIGHFLIWNDVLDRKSYDELKAHVQAQVDRIDRLFFTP